ncbi:nucleolar protein 14 isoform X2 [Phoenix dactylifera]|uniref:Nucleolar protein 14 isoform X2 n=1 Tax=Phoenix dactylifera TaxID=42345 RepID=A0A8B8ZG17_PHODC|nr:nucleolar protein 14 isoform X2 [Phoenix dactylifera]
MAKTKAQLKSSSSSKKKKKSARSLLSGPAAAAMKAAKCVRANPFETIWSRRKFDILGKKRKGEERRVGLARSLAIQKRKKTLLKEYEESTKSSKFLDKRIGEKDDTLQEFDKAVMRMQREHQLKLKRTSKYNLSDGEEDDSLISQVDDFEDEIPPDDDEDAFLGTEMSANSSKHLSLHLMPDSSETSLPDEEEKAHKSKKQVMLEIISKSKYYKAQKANDREEDEHLTEKLDTDFTSLAQTDALLSLTQPSKINALKALLNKSDGIQSSKEAFSGSADKESFFNKEQPDAYDKLVKELVLDRRAQPSDRTKTPEEIAQEERERLEKLEEKRQKRMLATDDTSDEDSDDGENRHEPALKNFRAVSGDDLGDSFSMDESIANKSGWVDDIYENQDVDDHDQNETNSEDSERNGHEGSDDDDGEGNENDTSCNDFQSMSTMKDWEQSDDDDLDLDGEEAEGPDEEHTDINNKMSMDMQKQGPLKSHKSNAMDKLTPSGLEALPFVIEAPNNLTELCSLLDNRSDTEVIEAINRIRACNSIRLAAENRKKMQVFYGVLLQYFAVLATRSPLNIKIINSLVRPLIEMSVETPYFAAICARQRLIHIRTRFCEDIKIPGKSSWPTLKTLLLLRLWSLIFPCSDFRHVVMTPALLLMCEYLMRCPIESGRDVAVGSFLCSMVFSVTKQSRKLFPEAIVFLQTLLMSSIGLEFGLQHHSKFIHLKEIKGLKPWLSIRDQVCDVHPIDFLKVMDMQADSPFFTSDNFKASILLSVAETLKGFINVYEELSSFPEIFLPISALLHELLQKAKLPGILRGNMEDVIDLIKKKTDNHHVLRQPLQMRKQKRVPIKLLNPKFEENFVKGRDYDPDRERAERKKMKKRLKSEKKGAIRELRKDNHFIFELKERDRMLEEEERAERYGKAMAFLQEQEHAFKSGQLGKGRKRRK